MLDSKWAASCVYVVENSPASKNLEAVIGKYMDVCFCNNSKLLHESAVVIWKKRNQKRTVDVLQDRVNLFDTNFDGSASSKVA